MKPVLSESDLPRSIGYVLREARVKLEPASVILFGSRARGDHKPASDFDLAFLGVHDDSAWARFQNYITYDAPCIYGIDVVRYESVSPALREKIDEEGIVLGQ